MLKNTLIIPLIVIVTGVILSAFSSWSVYHSEQNSIMNEFVHDVDVRAESLHREVSVNFEALRALSILFNQGEPPSHREFSEQAKKILARHSDIQALEWIPRVRHSQRAEFESSLQRLIPGFEFVERKSQGEMITAKEREIYYPVYYIEPVIGNETAIGFDLSSSSTRLETLEESVNSGQPLATASITLVQDINRQKGFLAVLPIFKELSITQKKRNENLLGFVLGVYRIQDIFMSSALTNSPLEISMTLVDETSAQADTLYVQNKRGADELYSEFEYKTRLPELWGRNWSIVATPSLSYVASRSSPLPLVIAITGTGFAFIIALYIYVLVNRATTVKTLVAEKTRELTEANRKLAQLSRTDGLTGLVNRGHFNEVLKKEWALAMRNQTALSLILLDIDYFKAYNDTYGHPEGDLCLKRVAKCLSKIVKRPSDVVARYGGEEFAIILPDTLDAKSVANRCREAVEALGINHNASYICETITISLGVCTMIPQQNSDSGELVTSADKALYRSKEQGRNRVTIHGQGPKLSISKTLKPIS